MRIENWPTAIVVVCGLHSTAAVVVFLANAGWQAESILAFGTLAVGVFAGQAVTARKASQLADKTDEQSEKLATIVKQTNGLQASHAAGIAETAAARAIVKYEARQREQGH